MKTGIHIKSCVNVHSQIPTPNLQTNHHLYFSHLGGRGVPMCLLSFPSLRLGAVQFPSPPSFWYFSSIGSFLSSYKYAQVPPKKNRENSLSLSASVMSSSPSGFLKMIYPPSLSPLTSPFTPQTTAAWLSMLPPIPDCKIPRPSFSPYLT